jgi:kynurenine formamidase
MAMIDSENTKLVYKKERSQKEPRMRFIDLSATIGPSDPNAKPYERVEIRYTGHCDGAAQIQALLGVPSDLLRDREGWAVEEFIALGTHSVTHVDAPWHYNSIVEGRKAATIDELPLNWFFADAVVLELTHKRDNEHIDIRDLEIGLAEINYVLNL